jgi:hypothetical protein
MSELTFTSLNRNLRDVTDIYMSELTATCSNRCLRDVIDLYMSERQMRLISYSGDQKLLQIR